MSDITDHTLETYKSLVTLAAQSLKVLQLLNGGAIVALLAYLGQISNRAEVIPSVMCPSILFVIGLVAAVGAHFGAYFTQLARFNKDVSNRGTESGQNEIASRYEQTEKRWLTATVVLGGASLALFATGALIAVIAFSGSPSS